jgi:hypothetical protein
MQAEKVMGARQFRRLLGRMLGLSPPLSFTRVTMRRLLG